MLPVIELLCVGNEGWTGEQVPCVQKGFWEQDKTCEFTTLDDALYQQCIYPSYTESIQTPYMASTI